MTSVTTMKSIREEMSLGDIIASERGKNTARPHGARKKTPKKDKDWICAFCDFRNWPKWTNCLACQQPCPEQRGTGVSLGEVPAEEEGVEEPVVVAGASKGGGRAGVARRGRRSNGETCCAPA